MIHPLRILMSEADAPGGSASGGAAPVVAVETTPAEPQAQAAAPPPVDAEAIAAKVHDKVFAALRQAGVFKDKSKPKPADDGTPPATAQTQQIDPIKLRKLDRSLTKAGLATVLTPTQYERAERMFVAEDPDDVDGWVQDVFHGYQAAPTAAPAAPAAIAAAPAAPKPQNAHPVTDRGAPPPSQVPLEEADLVTMSESDRAALIKQKGVGWYVQQLQKQVKGRAVKFR